MVVAAKRTIKRSFLATRQTVVKKGNERARQVQLRFPLALVVQGRGSADWVRGQDPPSHLVAVLHKANGSPSLSPHWPAS